MAEVELTLNGRLVRFLPRPGETLLEALRQRCGILSTKDGCQPQGQCGCCLALVNGQPKTTCAIPAERAGGAQVLTLEGIPSQDRELLSRCFVAAAGLQCGFCIPGLALRAWHLVQSHPAPDRDRIARAIDIHLCRCTGYVRVLDAIQLYARARAGEALPEPCRDGGVGSSLARWQGEETTLGDRPFVDDLVRPGMLHGAVTFSAHARARVRRIDGSRAAALPGVVAVLTAADVPGERWYGLLRDDWPGLVAEGEEVRAVGDMLAVVAAEDRATAREAAQLVEVDYEVLSGVHTPEEALRPGAPQVNPRHPNLLARTTFRRGDVEDALASAAHVVAGTWRTQRVEHLYLEPESAVAVPEPGDRLRLYTQGQGVFDDRRQVARFLALEESRLSVTLVPSGGAFGGKEDLSIQPHAALLARKTGRPVKLTLTREQSVRLHPKRHPITIDLRAGCDAEGRLLAVQARLVGDTGAYASVGEKVLERAAGHMCGPYRVPRVDIEAVAVCTNNPPCGAMRGFGANQAAFAMEGCLDLLAEQVGLDGWEIRMRNALQPGDPFTTGQILETSVGIRRTLEAVKEIYHEARGRGRAVGIGCAIKNCGIGNGAAEWGRARLVVEKDGTISLYNGYTEMGQGLLTVLVQCAVEVTGLDPSLFRPRVDTTFELSCGQTTASRATMLGGRAVVQAAGRLKEDLVAGHSLADLAGKVYAGDVVIEDTTPPDAPADRVKSHTAYGFATQVCILDEAGRVDRVVAAHDVGRAINPDLCAAQIEGAIHMGLGYALTEELPCTEGMPVTFGLRELGVLRARDMPRVEVILVEEHEPEGPFGAKGVGEIGLVPTAGAVAGALAAHDGVRRYSLPMKDSAAAHALSVGRIRARSHREAWR